MSPGHYIAACYTATMKRKIDLQVTLLFVLVFALINRVLVPIFGGFNIWAGGIIQVAFMACAIVAMACVMGYLFALRTPDNADQ